MPMWLKNPALDPILARAPPLSQPVSTPWNRYPDISIELVRSGFFAMPARTTPGTADSDCSQRRRTGLASGRIVTAQLGVDRESDQLVRAESGIESFQVEQAACEQSGSPKQQHGECDLRHHQDLAKPARGRRRPARLPVD